MQVSLKTIIDALNTTSTRQVIKVAASATGENYDNPSFTAGADHFNAMFLALEKLQAKNTIQSHKDFAATMPGYDWDDAFTTTSAELATAHDILRKVAELSGHKYVMSGE